MYKFLIIVPTLNSYKQLPKLINSLNKQKYKNWQVLFVDGKSNKKHKCFLKETIKTYSNFSYIEQAYNSKGIYGAMNDGIKYSKDSDYVLFWGSDDFCSDDDIFDKIIKFINHSEKNMPDILLFKASYFNESNNKFLRESLFLNKIKILNSTKLNRLIFLGNSPAHQATIFNTKLIYNNYFYNTNYRLAADLELFLRLISNNNISLINTNINIVNLGNKGISNSFTLNRLKEVIYIYFKYFGLFFIFPFFLRYWKRLNSKK